MIEAVKFEQPAQQIVSQEYIDTVILLDKRVKAFDEHIERGVSLLGATSIVAEIGDLTRFANAPQLMAYLGLVPSEHSSGTKQSRGGITKTGNSHVRRLIIEAAWAYRHPARKTKCIQQRAKRTTQEAQDIAWKAQTRLCSRYQRLEERGNAMTLDDRARHRAPNRLSGAL
jgi:transposase